MKVHIIHGHRDHSELTKSINEWIKSADRSGYSVRDIEYG